MRVFQITHEIFEPDGPSPDVAIVVHVFRGKTQAEAKGYFKAHQGTDSFFAGAVQRGSWNGMRLQSRTSQGWVES